MSGIWKISSSFDSAVRWEVRRKSWMCWGICIFVKFVLRHRQKQSPYLKDSLYRKCDDFVRQFFDNVEVKLLPHTGFQKLVSLDSSWEKQTMYGWANMTVLVPDTNSEEWKDLRLTQEVEEKRCGKTNSKKKTAPPNEWVDSWAFLDTRMTKRAIVSRTSDGSRSQ